MLSVVPAQWENFWPWLHCQKNFWPRVLGSVVIQLYIDECTPSVDQALVQ